MSDIAYDLACRLDADVSMGLPEAGKGGVGKRRGDAQRYRVLEEQVLRVNVLYKDHSDNEDKCWQRYRDRGTLIHYWGVQTGATNINKCGCSSKRGK